MLQIQGISQKNRLKGDSGRHLSAIYLWAPAGDGDAGERRGVCQRTTLPHWVSSWASIGRLLGRVYF